MPIVRGKGAGVSATMPLKQSSRGGSGSFLVMADDGLEYWCKALNNPQSPRVPVNEQIVARLGQHIGASVTEPMLVRLDGIVGWEYRPGHTVEPGWAHGCRALKAPIETNSITDHRTEDNNRVRQAGFYALMDWMHGADQQWLKDTQAENAYYSHDHGHFFPSGPNWDAAALAAAGTTACSFSQPADELDATEFERLAAAIATTALEDIEAVMSKIPAAWPVSDQELSALAAFIDARRGPVAARLRALVP